MSIAATNSCSAMEETHQDIIKRNCRIQLARLKPEIKEAEQIAASLTTGPSLRINALSLIAARERILAQATAAHTRIAPISVSMAREFTMIIHRARILIIEA